MGTRYWRSLEELAGTPELQRMLEREFPSVAAQWRENGGDGPSRRHFLKLMGASLALGGMTGCRWPKEHIMPASRQPVNRVPGVPVQYATTFELGGVGTGVLVTSYDGRPIKIEGNPKHPFSRGKTNAWMQASVLELYDPDRSHDVLRLVGALRDRPPAGQAPAGQPPAGQTPSGQPSAGRSRAGQTVRHEVRTWAEFEAFAKSHFAGLRANRGAGLGIIAGVSA
ncbi:MAG: TAT-variant-translocated molybdopterin oxidoreductase, partial [Planctomycetota bacterium]